MQKLNDKQMFIFCIWLWVYQMLFISNDLHRLFVFKFVSQYIHEFSHSIEAVALNVLFRLKLSEKTPHDWATLLNFSNIICSAYTWCGVPSTFLCVCISETNLRLNWKWLVHLFEFAGDNWGLKATCYTTFPTYHGYHMHLAVWKYPLQ